MPKPSTKRKAAPAAKPTPKLPAAAIPHRTTAAQRELEEVLIKHDLPGTVCITDGKIVTSLVRISATWTSFYRDENNNEALNQQSDLKTDTATMDVIRDLMDVTGKVRSRLCDRGLFVVGKVARRWAMSPARGKKRAARAAKLAKKR